MTTTTYPLASEKVVALSRADRCDRCRARAYVRATLNVGAELLFCGHHANEHRAALAVAGASFHDETAKLTIARESGFSV
jgi:hypothetical protein